MPHRRLHQPAVDEDLPVAHLDQHGAESAFPNVPLHAMRGQGQVQLWTRFGASEDIGA